MSVTLSIAPPVRAAVRRFVWLVLVIYAALTVGLWLAHALAPSSIGAVTDYTISVSLIGAVTFGGLFAAGTALVDRPDRPQGAAT